MKIVRQYISIWRYFVVNGDTQSIIGQAKTFDNPINEGLPFLENRPGNCESNRGFFAVFGCPNGSGVARMLTDHCTTLDHKTITSIRVLNDSQSIEPPSMYFVLADCDITTPAKKSKRPCAGQKRYAKRHQKDQPGQVQGPIPFGKT